jgi:hypothetical protein
MGGGGLRKPHEKSVSLHVEKLLCGFTARGLFPAVNIIGISGNVDDSDAEFVPPYKVGFYGCLHRGYSAGSGV